MQNTASLVTSLELDKSTVKKVCMQVLLNNGVFGYIHKLIHVPTVEEACATTRMQTSHYPVFSFICVHANYLHSIPSLWNINCEVPGCAYDTNVVRQSTLFSRAHLLPKVSVHSPNIVAELCF